MSVENIVDSVRRIVKRYCCTNSPLTVDADAGDSSITVKSTHRFQIGDEVLLRDSSTMGEIDLYIDDIPDRTTLVLSRPLNTDFKVSKTSVVEKLIYHQFVQGVYIGEPQAISHYPAVTVNPVSRSSEPFTLDSWKEIYNLQIAVYVEDSNQEDAFRFLLKMVDLIQYGLKNHIYPLVAPYATTALTEDITSGDTYIKVEDSSVFKLRDNHRLLIEDPYDSSEFTVNEIIDEHTLSLGTSIDCDYKVSDGTIAISAPTFVWNSWPATINYGKVFKGTMLKAATIDWFAWVDEVHYEPPQNPSIL